MTTTEARAIVVPARRELSGVTRYVIALAAPTVSLIASLLLEPYLTRTVFILFWPAVLGTAAYAGLGPALVASTVSVLAVDYVFISPTWSLHPGDVSDLAPLGIFFLTSGVVSTLANRRRSAEDRAIAAARENAALAAQLESQLEAAQAISQELEKTSGELQQQSQEAQAAQHEAESANRAKSQFLAAMSHELRTPLNAIGGYVDLLQIGVHGPLNPEQQSDLERIQRAQRHLVGLITEVLEFARIEAGRVEYKRTRVSVVSVFADLRGFVDPQLRENAIKLRIEPPPADLAVRADAEKVRQILINLLSNSVKFTPAGGRIEVHADRSGSTVRIQVTDTGIGIAREKIESIFEPFVQAHRTLTSPTEGVGLGLAISRDLARGMGGDLTVESTAGAGARFTLALPAD